MECSGKKWQNQYALQLEYIQRIPFYLSGSTSWRSDLYFCVWKDKLNMPKAKCIHKWAVTVEASTQVGDIPQAFDDAFSQK